MAMSLAKLDLTFHAPGSVSLRTLFHTRSHGSCQGSLPGPVTLSVWGHSLSVGLVLLHPGCAGI